MMEIYITCFLEILSSSSRCRRFETEVFFRRPTMVDNNISQLVASLPPQNFFHFYGPVQWKTNFTEKNFFNIEKYKWKFKIYISHFRNIFFTQKTCYKQNINLKYIFILKKKKKKKKKKDKNIFVKISLWTQWSGP